MPPVKPSSAGSHVTLHRVAGHRDRPEQAGCPDARLEIMNLCRQVAHGAREEIDSDEAERPDAPAPIATDVRALHEAHVGVERVGAAVAATRGALRLAGGDPAAKVGDGGHLEPQGRRQHVNERVLRDEVEVLVESAGDRTRLRSPVRERRSGIQQPHRPHGADRRSASPECLATRHPHRRGSLDHPGQALLREAILPVRHGYPLSYRITQPYRSAAAVSTGRLTGSRFPCGYAAQAVVSPNRDSIATSVCSARIGWLPSYSGDVAPCVSTRWSSRSVPASTVRRSSRRTSASTCISSPQAARTGPGIGTAEIRRPYSFRGVRATSMKLASRCLFAAIFMHEL